MAGEPAMACMVITVDEAGEVAAADRVTVALQVGAHGLFVKADATTPIGRVPRTLKVTGGAAGQPVDVVVIVSTPPGAPFVIVKVEGLAANVKSMPPHTTRVKVAVRVTAGVPPLAWTVIIVDEAGAVAEAVRVTFAEQVGLQGLLVNVDAVMPVGRVVRIVNVTGTVVAPVARVAVAVSTLPVLPTPTVRTDGLASRLKSKNGCVTTRVKVAV